MKKIYFAGPWFTEQANTFYEKVKTVVDANDEYSVFYPKYQNETIPKKVFDGNVNNIKECDLVVALVEHKDTGTAWEIGMAYVLGKKIYLVVNDEESCKKSKTNLMLAMTGKFVSADKLDKALNGTADGSDFINFNDGWRNIE